MLINLTKKKHYKGFGFGGSSNRSSSLQGLVVESSNRKVLLQIRAIQRSRETIQVSLEAARDIGYLLIFMQNLRET